MKSFKYVLSLASLLVLQSSALHGNDGMDELLKDLPEILAGAELVSEVVQQRPASMDAVLTDVVHAAQVDVEVREVQHSVSFLESLYAHRWQCGIAVIAIVIAGVLAYRYYQAGKAQEKR